MPEQSTLKINKQTLPFLNLALYLHDIKPIQFLTIENTSETDSAPIVVRITADLACIEPYSYNIPLVPAQVEVRIPLENLKVNRDFLNKLSETEKANITIEVSEKEVVILSETIAVNIHPIEHFGGFNILPELIAAYVTPNHPYVYRIKRKAVEFLEKQGLKSAFEGYRAITLSVFYRLFQPYILPYKVKKLFTVPYRQVMKKRGRGYVCLIQSSRKSSETA